MLHFLDVQCLTEESPPSSQATTTTLLPATSSGATNGIDLAVEFKAVEHPTEPLDNDQPIHCPLPEPSLHNVSFTL